MHEHEYNCGNTEAQYDNSAHNERQVAVGGNDRLAIGSFLREPRGFGGLLGLALFAVLLSLG